jgi:arginyl-tRNA synthetase
MIYVVQSYEAPNGPILGVYEHDENGDIGVDIEKIKQEIAEEFLKDNKPYITSVVPKNHRERKAIRTLRREHNTRTWREFIERALGRSVAHIDPFYIPFDLIDLSLRLMDYIPIPFDSISITEDTHVPGQWFFSE